MKKKFLKFGVGFLAVAALAGCGGGKALSASEFEIAVNNLATVVPLALDIVTGEQVPTNISREGDSLPIPELKNGNNLKLITSGTLHYEDEENNVFLYPDFKISWSYLVSDSTAKFDFQEDEGFMLGIPDYPKYKEGEDIPARVAARLYAKITIGKRTETLNIDVILKPQAIIEEYTIAEIRSEAVSKQIVKVKGYVHGILADWNSVGIADGDWGIGLYRTDTDYVDKFKIGDLVEAIGEYSVYNGLTQIQFIKSITVLDPENFPAIKKPTLTTYTMDELYETIESGWPGQPTNTLFGRDNSIVTFDAPFRFKEVQDRDGKVVGFAGFDTGGSSHTNVILVGTDSTGYKFDVILSINYHIGSANQTAIKNWLEANQDKDIYYRGAISAYNKFVLGPYEFAGHFANTQFTE